MIFCLKDFETTGLTRHPLADIRRQPRAIEFAAILTDGETILDQTEFICNPGVPLEPIITKITGLKDSDLIDKSPFSDYVEQIADFMAGSDAIIAHNLSFDKAIMTYELARLGHGLEMINYPAIEICTVEQTLPLYGRRMKMTELYEELAGPYVQKHRAMDDILMLHEICKTLGVYKCFHN